MDALLDENEREIVDQTRAFLADNCSPALVRKHELNGGFSRELWDKIIALGWLDTALPETMGGLDLPLIYMTLIFEELGRAIAPVPMLSVAVPSLVIARYGTDEQKALVEQARLGKVLFAFALQEEAGAWDAQATQLSGRIEGDKLILDGVKSFVDNFEHCDYVLVSFRGEQGLGLALIDAHAVGIERTDLVPTAKDSQSLLRFDGVRVALSSVVSGGEEAIEKAMDLAALFTTSYMVGASRKATEMSVTYACERIAFGQPIGSFQAIQHTCSDMIIGVDGAELLAREAAWRIGAGLDGSLQVSQAKAFANDKCVFACRSAQQIHGGIGFIMEFDLQLWYRRVVSNAMRYGSTPEHRSRVAAVILGNSRKIRLDWSEMPEPAGILEPSAARLDSAA